MTASMNYPGNNNADLVLRAGRADKPKTYCSLSLHSAAGDDRKTCARLHWNARRSVDSTDVTECGQFCTTIPSWWYGATMRLQTLHIHLILSRNVWIYRAGPALRPRTVAGTCIRRADARSMPTHPCAKPPMRSPWLLPPNGRLPY